MCGPISCDLWQAVWVKNSMTPQSTKPLISLLPYLCSPLKTPSFASFVIMSKLEASKSIKIFHLFLEPSFVFVLLLFFLSKKWSGFEGRKKKGAYWTRWRSRARAILTHEHTHMMEVNTKRIYILLCFIFLIELVLHVPLFPIMTIAPTFGLIKLFMIHIEGK